MSPPQRVYDLAIQRLEAKGKGILLLHDIQARTVAALPRILHELKARGYRIVHVVPATPERPATPTEPQQWQLHPASEMVATSRWPKIPNFVFAEHRSASRAGADRFRLAHTRSRRIARGARAAFRCRGQTLWSRQMTLVLDHALAALPVPAASVFKIPESTRVTMLADGVRPHIRSGLAEVSAKLAGKPRRQSRRRAAVQPAALHARQPPRAKPTGPPRRPAARRPGRTADPVTLPARRSADAS